MHRLRPLALFAVCAVLALTTPQMGASNPEEPLAESEEAPLNAAPPPSLPEPPVPEAPPVPQEPEAEAPEPQEKPFVPYDLPMALPLQLYAHDRSLRAGIDPGILFAIITHESGGYIDAINYNANGTVDIGLCQLNSCNWAWLAQRGVDVHTPEGNIDGALLILSTHLEKYPLPQAIAAYGVGEGGMLKGGGAAFAAWVLEAAAAREG